MIERKRLFGKGILNFVHISFRLDRHAKKCMHTQARGRGRKVRVIPSILDSPRNHPWYLETQHKCIHPRAPKYLRCLQRSPMISVQRIFLFSNVVVLPPAAGVMTPSTTARAPRARIIAAPANLTASGAASVLGAGGAVLALDDDAAVVAVVAVYEEGEELERMMLANSSISPDGTGWYSQK